MELPDSISCPITEDPDTTLARQMYDRGAIEAATASWLESFSENVEEVLEPLHAQLMVVLSQVGKGILVGREFRNLQDVQQIAADLCRDAIRKLEGLSESFPEEALSAPVWRWDTLAESVASFLTKSWHPATAPDMQVLYNMALRPRTVDIALPASRIANTVLFMVGESVCRATQEVMKEAATAAPAAAAAPRAVVELNPAESARSYSSVYPWAGYDKSALDWPDCCRSPGLGASAQPGAEWAQMDLGEVLRVRGVVTQGHVDAACWLTQYDVHVSTDGAAFHRVAGGPLQVSVSHGNERATATFAAAVHARYVRISPRSWHSWPHLRCGVIAET